MKLSYELATEDIVSFNIYHFQNSKTAKKRRVIQRFFIPVWVIMIFLFFNIKNLNLVSITSNAPLLVFGILWFLFIDKYYFWRIKSNVEKLLQEDKNNGMIGKQNVEVRDELLVVENDSGLTQYKLETINKIDENEKYLFIYVTSVSAIVIPKKVFQNYEKDSFVKELNK